MDKIKHTSRRAAGRPGLSPGKGGYSAVILCLAMFFAMGAGAEVLTDPSGNTLTQYAVTSGGNVATGGGGYTLTSAVGLVSGPLSSAPAGDTLFHGIPGPLFPSGPAPDVVSITRVSSERTNAASVQFTVTFSDDITGADSTDFYVATSGTLSGCAVTDVSQPSNPVLLITVSTGTGDGTLRLDVVDDDTIKNFSAIPLGGVGEGNGDYAGGQTYSVDKTIPTGKIVVNNNRSATNNRNVTLALTWSDGTGLGVSRMRFSNDGSNWSSWEVLAATRAWALAAGADAHRTVRVQYLDKANNYSPIYEDYIRLDTTLPTGTIIINSGAATTTSRTVKLNLTWNDGTGSQVSRMRFSDNGSTWTYWMPPSATRNHTLPEGALGNRTVRVQYLDGANNYSLVYNDYIKLVAP